MAYIDPFYTDLPGEMAFRDAEANSIKLNAGGSDMIKVTKDGFYVRGVKVPADEKEALAVYNAFKEWLTWSQLTRTS